MKNCGLPQVDAKRSAQADASGRAMSRFAKLFVLLLSLTLLSTWSGEALAAAKFARVAGNWSVPGTAVGGTWSSSCAAAAVTPIPTNLDDVTICDGINVTVDAAGVAGSVTIAGGVTTTALTLGAAGTLTVTDAGGLTGDVTIQAPTSNVVTKQIVVGTRSLTITGNVTINGGTTGGGAATRTSQLTVTSGTVTIGTVGSPKTLSITAGTATTYLAQVTLSPVTGVGTITVNGDVTLTGGANATGDALLNVAGISNAGTGVIITGNLNVNSTIATSSTVSMTGATGGRITVGGNVNNGDTLTVGAGIFTANGATFTNNNTAIVANTTVSTGSLSIAGDLINGSTGTNTGIDTITLSSTGIITVGGTLTNNTGTTNGTITTTTTGTINANGNFLNNGVFIHSAAGNLNLRGTTATMNGTFTRTLTTGKVTSNKLTAGAQTLSGTALAFSNFIMNSANGVTLGANATVNTLLTLTSGKITTGANNVIIGTAGTIATPTASSYVVGNFQKNYAASANLNYFAGNGFPVGDATNFTPVDISAGTITAAAGSLTVSTFTPDHPQVTTPIASTGIDAAKSVNRYWRFANSGLTIATAITAKFTFVATDRDNVVDTPSYIIERYDGTNWNPTTAGAANALDTTASNITPLAVGNNDFAIGVPFAGFNSIPGAFNVFEASTPANAILGRIYTKIVGTAITLQVVAVNAGRTGVNTLYTTNPITVDLLDARNNTGAITAATNCRSTWFPPSGPALISTQSLSPVWTSGRSATITITAPVNAWRDVRVRVTNGANIGCSTDRFAIRPTAFSSITSTANNNTTGAGTTIKTGQNFTINALTALSGYDNGLGATLANPALISLIDNTSGMVVGSPNQGTIGGTFSAASGGTASGTSFYYSEVGNFGLAANAIYDNVFTAVDQPNDCVTTAGLNFSNTADVNGKYGCNFGSAAIALASGFGRFIPDNFAVSYNPPQFTTACGIGAFTYVGQPFVYATTPVITVQARNGTTNGLTNAPTTNYAGAYMKFSNAAGTSLNQAPYNTQTGRYSRFDALGGGTTPALDTTGLPATTSDPVIGTFNAGLGTLTFGSGTGLAFTRSTSTPNAPFSADIALTLNVIDTDGVAAAGAASFGTATSGGGITFNSGNNFRFGRLKLSNAYGSELLNLPVPIQTQYWNSAAFVTNTADNCTTLTANNIKLTTTLTGVNATVGGAFYLGVGSLTLTKPTPAAKGVVALCVDLDNSGTGDTTCVASAPFAAIPYLHTGTAYDKDPTAQATFGVYKGHNEFIYMRENY